MWHKTNTCINKITNAYTTRRLKISPRHLSLKKGIIQFLYENNTENLFFLLLFPSIIIKKIRVKSNGIRILFLHLNYFDLIEIEIEIEKYLGKTILGTRHGRSHPLAKRGHGPPYNFGKNFFYTFLCILCIELPFICFF